MQVTKEALGQKKIGFPYNEPPNGLRYKTYVCICMNVFEERSIDQEKYYFYFYAIGIYYKRTVRQKEGRDMLCQFDSCASTQILKQKVPMMEASLGYRGH